MSIESLKQQARKHEQNEDWKKALEQYDKALAELAREEQVDIGLYNRVGDLYVRIGGLDDAVEHYEKAVDLYREAYLPNNAIAVCKKIIRNVPDHHRAYLQMGQIRAEQGFLPDARTQFLTYAERMQQAGHIDESFRALIEFCDLAPDDVGVRVTVAEQMAAKGLANEAIEQLAVAHRHFTQLGENGQAQDVEKKILEIDPEADMAAISAVAAYSPSSVSADGEVIADFGEINLGDDAFADVDNRDTGFGLSDTLQDAAEEASAENEAEAETEVEIDAGLAGFEIESGALDVDGGDAEEEETSPLLTVDLDEVPEDSTPLPTMDLDDVPEDSTPLPTMDLDDVPEDSSPLPTMDFDSESSEDETVPSIPAVDFTPAVDFSNEEPDGAGGVEIPAIDFSVDETDTVSDAIADAAEEVSFDVPVPELPDTLEVPDVPEVVEAAPEAVAPEAPSEDSSNGGYVDLGAMILGGGDEKKSTRFTVAYEEPSGDEEADFAKMLSQFKEKVSENLDSSDVRAHYDLGTAYKEMGLLDEAISSFQAALRASPDHLPTYELMGQTFMEMGQPEAAVRSLERAVESGSTIEDELVGIYYYLGRAYEEIGSRESAVEYYDRVFALDINFADVTERLRELR